MTEDTLAKLEMIESAMNDVIRHEIGADVETTIRPGLGWVSFYSEEMTSKAAVMELVSGIDTVGAINREYTYPADEDGPESWVVVYDLV